MWVLGPPPLGARHLHGGEAECVRAHQGSELSAGEAQGGHLLDHGGGVVAVGELWEVTLLGIFAAHPEDHGGTPGILDCRVTTELDEVSVGKNGRDVVSIVLDLLDLLHGKFESCVLMALQLLWETKGATGATQNCRSAEASIVVSSTKHVSHAR